MRKEVIIAIVFGGLLGVVIAFGATRVNKSFKNAGGSSQQTNASQKKASEPNQVSATGLTIVSPSDAAVQTNSIITVSGLTIPKSTVVVVGAGNTTLTTASGNGEWELDVELTPGLNNLTIYSFNDSQDAKTHLLTIHTTKLGENSDNETEAQTVENRLEEARKPILAYLGTVTDITDKGVQLKSDSGEISQVNLAENTTYANIVKETKEVTFTDLAIGDFVAALGYVDENNLLTAVRILITLPPKSEETETTKVLKGKVDTLSASEFLVTDAEGAQLSIDAKGGVVVTGVDESGEISKIKFADIADGDSIIIIGEMEKEELSATRIHKI
jgi:hypothetical protein